jgi:hypothetical protein
MCETGLTSALVAMDKNVASTVPPTAALGQSVLLAANSTGTPDIDRSSERVAAG